MTALSGDNRATVHKYCISQIIISVSYINIDLEIQEMLFRRSYRINDMIIIMRGIFYFMVMYVDYLYKNN